MKKRSFYIRWVVLLLLCNNITNAFAQDNPQPYGVMRMVNNYKAQGKTFVKTDVFSSLEEQGTIPMLNSHSAYIYNTNVFDRLFANNEKLISVSLTINNAPKELLLVRQDIFAEKYIVSKSDGSEQAKPDLNLAPGSSGIHYAGYIVGEERTSIVSLSLFHNRAYGFITSTNLGNITICKLNNSDDNIHISYDMYDLPQETLNTLKSKYCNTEREGPLQMPYQDGENPGDNPYDEGSYDDGDIHESSISGPCVRMFLEISNDVFDDLGGDYDATRQYGIALFSQSATLFLNELILVRLSQINLWTVPSPYVGLANTSSARLNGFRSTWGGGYNGDIAMMIDMGTGGGRAALNDVNSFCDDPEDRMGYLGLSYIGASRTTGYNFYLPGYTWQVSAFTHEVGHIFGSEHTHDCVWGSGGSNAIDGCGPTAGYGSSPGGCSTGPIPSNGGTIMSYCHLISGVGINLRLGFGSQPNTRMRVLLASVNCIDECEVRCPYSYTFYQHNRPLANFPFTWNAYYFIHSTAKYTLVSGDHLEYNAGRYINLYPGFETTITGGLFLARIEGCELDHYDESNNASNPNKQGHSITDAKFNINKYGISIYPNPNIGAFTIELPQNGNYDVDVSNVLGVIVYTGKIINQSKYDVKLDDKLPVGNYAVRITNNKTRHVQKIAIAR